MRRLAESRSFRAAGTPSGRASFGLIRRHPDGGARGTVLAKVFDAASAAAHKDARRLQRQRHRLVAALRTIPGIGWVRAPTTRIGRLLVGAALILGGLLGFLPVLGYWMIPLGLLVLAQDVPWLRRPVGWAVLVVERRWRRWRRRSAAATRP